MMRSKIFRVFSGVFLIIVLIVFFKIVNLYNKVYRPNIFTRSEKYVYIYVPTGSSFEDVMAILDSNLVIKNKKALNWVINKKNYKSKVKPGRYKIKNRANNNELVNLLRAGWQAPVNVTFNNVRTSADLAKKISEQIECKEEELIVLLNDEKIIHSYGFTKETFPCMFIPNSYEFFWNTTAQDFLDRMKIEYSRFWNSSRLEQAQTIGLSPEQVSALASIVDQETLKNDEKARIAGVYINRLNKKIRLQADPTVKYALGDFTIKRILKKHLTVNSPYNTYKNSGLPPGPICFPSIQGIDAVLNYESHRYMYFCAKENFSGYHNFATNLKDHNRNAEKYRRALNKNRIYK